ncbi:MULTISPECIES: IclR family transcriptional regulator [Ramlibacter]|jgi:DNA-binding IclR family transcriptional regulator|uniref:Helix-turn-helix domain-containing protein n=1 Tax=Ramlibacter pinisoli TaxID=2682844 RepID=A0A6N8IW03_9BURK|nr:MULTISPECIES: IclR family transcriptional regulator [Ramlibacter]MBA2961023.1 IclR family transcriptional regulator [Ramlibacter sp. CGMCC 1.13660]MVQ30968.1 helix-turn-helix domain-containing protein [Ramlibacter pinisoli]
MTASTPPVTDSESPRNKYAVPALEKALDVLEYLSEQAVPLTQAQLARALGREPSELFRMLTVLEARGYLRRDDAGGYQLTLKLFELSRTHSPHEQLIDVATPLMRDLVDLARQSCHLSVLHRDKVLVLEQVESPQPVRLSVQIGSLHSPVATVSGQLLLAHLEAGERTELLARQADYLRMGARERQEFNERLERVRADGWAYAEGARFMGGIDLGVPIGSEGARTRAALTIAALKGPDCPDLFDLLPRLQQCAGEITRICGLG